MKKKEIKNYDSSENIFYILISYYTQRFAVLVIATKSSLLKNFIPVKEIHDSARINDLKNEIQCHILRNKILRICTINT